MHSHNSTQGPPLLSLERLRMRELGTGIHSALCARQGLIMFHLRLMEESIALTRFSCRQWRFAVMWGKELCLSPSGIQTPLKWSHFPYLSRLWWWIAFITIIRVGWGGGGGVYKAPYQWRQTPSVAPNDGLSDALWPRPTIPYNHQRFFQPRVVQKM